LADRTLEAPPPRRRVIERDGRLVVIDGGAPTSNFPQSRTARARWFEQTSFDGRGILTTRAWYDLKGPRRLALDSGSGKIARLAVIGMVSGALVAIGLAIAVPWVLVAIPALIQPKLWKRARERLTAWLDRFPAAP
jgi:hypothetical protein